MTYRGIAKGRVVQLDGDVSLPEGTTVTVLVQEPLRGSPSAVLQAMRGLPSLAGGEVDELERMIEVGKLPTRSGGMFDAAEGA